MMKIGDRKIGYGEPCYIISEIGINHNGDREIAAELIRAASEAGADAVKFQKRTLPRAIPAHMWDVPKDTPWGRISYLEYKQRLEFNNETYRNLANTAHSYDIDIGISIWDTASAKWAANIEIFDFLKIPSCHMSNEPIVHHTATRGLPFFWSTGMHEWSEIHQTVRWLDDYGFNNWGALHCNSSYPAKVSELNLNVIKFMRSIDLFKGHPIGYSGHETGLATTVAAIAVGANVIERHITLDRAIWGSDQSASIEPGGFRRLIRDIRSVEEALGDGRKRVYPDEQIKKDSLSLT